MMPTIHIGGCQLVDLGTGPRIMYGQTAHAPPVFWVAITFASAFGASLLILPLASITRRNIPVLRDAESLNSLAIAIPYHGRGRLYDPAVLLRSFL